MRSESDASAAASANAVGAANASSTTTSNMAQVQSGGAAIQNASGLQCSAQNATQLENLHAFQEYTFKKIASCDVCKDFLRGK